MSRSVFSRGMNTARGVNEDDWLAARSTGRHMRRSMAAATGGWAGRSGRGSGIAGFVSDILEWEQRLGRKLSFDEAMETALELLREYKLPTEFVRYRKRR